LPHNTERTVLFVSHNPAAVQQLCNRGTDLEKMEQVDMFGDVSQQLIESGQFSNEFDSPKLKENE